MIIRFTLLICLIFIGLSAPLYSSADSAAHAPSPAQTPTKKVRYDSTTSINERKISRKSLEEYYNDKTYAYDREITRQNSLWDMIQEWFFDLIQRLFGTKYGPKIWDAFIYILIAAAIALVNIILFRSNLRGLFFKAKSRAGITFDTQNENIHELNFPTLIATAEENADYRRAVRLQYLWLLKRLTDSETITWKINKTNRDYASEIQDKALKRDFKQLSMIFEYVWYGDTTIDAESYSRTKELFTSVHQQAASHEITA